MPPTLVLDIYRERVVLEMLSTRRSQEGSTSMIKIVRRPLGVVVGETGVFMWSVATLSAVSFMVAFVVHSSLAEIWIRLTRRRSTPGTSTKVLYKPAPEIG
jgi:hypothetical protein